jgi:DnaJ-class molecular chaperone
LYNSKLDAKLTIYLTEEEARNGTHRLIQCDDERITVIVPTGTKEGQKLRVTGKGNRQGLTRGDLYILVAIKSDAGHENNKSTSSETRNDNSYGKEQGKIPRRYLVLAITACVGFAVAGSLSNSVKAPVAKPTVSVPEKHILDMTPEEWNEKQCKISGISPGAPCKQWHKQLDDKREAEEKEQLERFEREAQEALDRQNNPGAHCSAVLNKCW